MRGVEKKFQIIFRKLLVLLFQVFSFRSPLKKKEVNSIFHNRTNKTKQKVIYLYEILYNIFRKKLRGEYLCSSNLNYSPDLPSRLNEA